MNRKRTVATPYLVYDYLLLLCHVVFQVCLAHLSCRLGSRLTIAT